MLGTLLIENAEMLEEENCTEYKELQKHRSNVKKEDSDAVSTCEGGERTLIVMMKEKGIESICKGVEQMFLMNNV